MKNILKKRPFFIFLSILLVLQFSIPSSAADRVYNVSISTSAKYNITKFQWNSEYTPVNSIQVNIDGKALNITVGMSFTLTITSVGPTTLVCEMDTEMEQYEVVCSNEFLTPYFPKFLFTVYTTINDWNSYADGVTTSNDNYEVQVDERYYQESITENDSGNFLSTFIKFNSQNGYLFHFYHQSYEDSNFKNFREIEISRTDTDSWTTDAPTIEVNNTNLDLGIILVSILIFTINRKRN